jgi:hypothetical protein
MFNRNAIKAEVGVLVPVYEKDKDGKPVFVKDKAGNILKDENDKPVRKVAEYSFENAFYHPHVKMESRIKLDDPLLVARVFRDFVAKGVKINSYAVFLPASAKGENGWQMLSLEQAVKLAESGERQLEIDTQKHGTVNEGGDVYRERKLRLKLRLTSEKKAKSVIPASDYFDVAAFYTSKKK